MKIKNILTTMLFVIVMILSMFVWVGSVEAAVVNTNTKSEEMYFDDHVTDCDSNCGSDAKGTFSFVLNKTINIFDENGNNKDYSFTLEKDKTVNLGNGATTGYWYLNYYFELYSWKKRVSPTELMDGILYPLYQVVGNYYAFSDYSTGLSIPIESTLPELTSGDQGILECNGTSCRAIKNGTTTITISFPVKTQSSPYSIYGTNMGYGKFNMTSRDLSLKYQYTYNTFTYSFPSITYTVTVPGTANTPHVSTCTGAANITKDSATVNWSYTDVDNDPQTQYQVQLSKKSYSDPTFSTSTDVVFAASNASASKSHTFTGLTSNTTYYARIKTQNAVNGWSTYSSCTFGFKTLFGIPSNPVVTGPDIGTVGTQYSFSAVSLQGNNNNGDMIYFADVDLDGLINLGNGIDQVSGWASSSVAKLVLQKSWTTTGSKTFNVQAYNGQYYSGWTSKTINIYEPTCSCNNTRTLTCTTNGVATTTDPGSSSCTFGSYCTAATTTATTTFTATSINGFGNITYSHGAISSTLPNTQQYSHSIPKVDGPQSLNIDLSDDYDGKTSTAYCTVNNSITPITLTPTISILKSPRISLNKNSKCKLDWDIQNMPATTTCALSGNSTGAFTFLPLSFNPNLTTSIKSWTSGPLQQNTKYTISCSGPNLTSTISKSAICRVNPSIGEI